MKRLTLAAVVASSLSVFAQGAPPPPPAKGPPAPAPKAAPAPAPAAAPAPAPAAAAAPAPAPAPAAMDMSKMGPAARKPTNEAKTKKEIEAWFKEGDALEAKKDWDALINRTDFPVFMLTDTLAGVPSAEATSKEAYVAMMKPMWENSPPMTMKHKFTIAVLSDSLANVVDDFDMTMGKQKVKGKNAMILVKVGGAWKVKSMMEAGWGDTGAPAAAPPPPPSGGVAAPPPAPGKAPPPPPPGKAAPAPAPAPAPGTGAAPPPPPKK